MDKQHYVYAYFRPDGTPYYVGMGNRYRAWEPRGHITLPPADKSMIRMLKTGLTRAEAHHWEWAMIEFWGREDLGKGPLHNLQDGGEGSPNRVCSTETREKMAARKRGIKQSALHIQARTGHKKGIKHAPEHAKNLREAICAKARVWWNHEDLGIRFFGTAPEVVEKFSDRFVGYKPPQGRGLRAGSKLCRNGLNKVQAGKLAHYKGWTKGVAMV